MLTETVGELPFFFLSHFVHLGDLARATPVLVESIPSPMPMPWDYHIYIHIYLSIYLSVYLSIYLAIYLI